MHPQNRFGPDNAVARTWSPKVCALSELLCLCSGLRVSYGIGANTASFVVLFFRKRLLPFIEWCFLTGSSRESCIHFEAHSSGVLQKAASSSSPTKPVFMAFAPRPAIFFARLRRRQGGEWRESHAIYTCELSIGFVFDPEQRHMGCGAIEVGFGGACIEDVDRFTFLGDFPIVIEYRV